MKRIQIWMLALVLTISNSTALTSCSKDDNDVSKPEQPLVLTGQAAVEWTKAHIRLNVLDYKNASWLIDSVVFIRLMDRAEAANNKTILFTMGMYGCGKTVSLNNNPELKKMADEVGVVSDGAYNSVAKFDKMVAQSVDRGFQPHLIYVYNDAETGYTNCMERLISANRAVTCEAYISVFPQFQGRVEYLEEHHPNMPLYCIDNNHNNGGKWVTNEEAKQWDYTMTEDLKQKIYAIKQSYIDTGKLTPEQIAALQ